MDVRDVPVEIAESPREQRLVSELRLVHPDFALSGTLAAETGTRVHPERRTAVGSETHLRFWAIGGDLDAFEAALSGDDTVESVRRTDTRPGRRRYRATLAPSVRQFGPTVAEFDGRLLDVYGEGPGWIVALELPARRALVAFHEHCLREGVEFRLRQFYAATPADAPSVGVSTREYDTLALAYERGYFDTPRGISQNELADALGVSQRVISRRLRSAVGRIVGEAVARRDEK